MTREEKLRTAALAAAHLTVARFAGTDLGPVTVDGVITDLEHAANKEVYETFKIFAAGVLKQLDYFLEKGLDVKPEQPKPAEDTSL